MDSGLIFAAADAAGKAAVEKLQVVPMVVGNAKSLFSNEIDYSQPTYYVADGVCGFASIQIKPATSAFAKWLKSLKLARKDDYYGGVSMPVFAYNQSYQKKVAYANAFTKVLSDYGINAWVNERLD